MLSTGPFPTIEKLKKEIGASWPGYDAAVAETQKAEAKLDEAIGSKSDLHRSLPADASLVLFGSYARCEMLEDSDYDWALLIDGVVDNQHAALSRKIDEGLRAKGLRLPGTSGTFGNMVFSHDLVHRIGGGADSNDNLTRRMLMLLESRPVELAVQGAAEAVWENVVGNILERYFEEDVHFDAKRGRRVPRFLLNDLTRYWRTICVDYAAKYREQDGRKWAVRNAKLRFSRKLLYATGLAFCLSCELDPPGAHLNLFGDPADDLVEPFVKKAKEFSRTPPLEYLAAFVDAFVADEKRKHEVATRIFGSYDWWLQMLADKEKREHLEKLDHAQAVDDNLFQEIRRKSSEFAEGLEMLCFGRGRDDDGDAVVSLVVQYIGF